MFTPAASSSSFFRRGRPCEHEHREDGRGVDYWACADLRRQAVIARTHPLQLVKQLRSVSLCLSRMKLHTRLNTPRWRVQYIDILIDGGTNGDRDHNSPTL